MRQQVKLKAIECAIDVQNFSAASQVWHKSSDHNNAHSAEGIKNSEETSYGRHRGQGRRNSNDRLELKREKKVKAIREKLGNQKGPDHHVAPNILGIGNSKLDKKIANGW